MLPHFDLLVTYLVPNMTVAERFAVHLRVVSLDFTTLMVVALKILIMLSLSVEA